MELVKLLLEDAITTGTGAAFTPGEGEQYATPFAFGKKGRKKKRLPIIKKMVFEEYTPEAGKVEYEKLNKALAEATSRVDRFMQAFKGFSVEKMLKDKSAVEQLKNLGERIWDNLDDIHNTADELAWKAEEKGDKEGYTNYTEITNSCRGLQETLDKIGGAIEAIQKASGSLNEGDYKLQHKATKLTTADDLEGGDTGFEWKYVKQIHDLNDLPTKESAAILFQLKGKPDKMVTIYRAAPEGVNEINVGDWVTLSKKYVKDYTEDKDTPKLLTKKVKASDLGWDGNDLNEFGYYPGGLTEDRCLDIARRKYPSCRPTPSQCSDKGKGKTWGKKSLKESEVPEIPKELSSIGTQEEYEKYLDTIFPDSKVKGVFYHGSPHKFDEFDKSKKGSNTNNKSELFYFTKHKSRLHDKSKPFFGNLYSALLNIKNPRVLEFEKDGYESATYRKVGSEDGIVLQDSGNVDPSNTEEVGVFEPEQIHILGSKKDIEGFKQYKNKTKTA